MPLSSTTALTPQSRKGTWSRLTTGGLRSEEGSEVCSQNRKIVLPYGADRLRPGHAFATTTAEYQRGFQAPLRYKCITTRTSTCRASSYVCDLQYEETLPERRSEPVRRKQSAADVHYSPRAQAARHRRSEPCVFGASRLAYYNARKIDTGPRTPKLSTTSAV